MHSLLPASSPASSADYRRQARRIRARFDRDPFLRHQALSRLAVQRNAETGSRSITETDRKSVTARRVEPGSGPTVVNIAERGFSRHAATLLQPFGFTFSDRVRLLDSAERLGISRFRANMLLAMQEHQAPARQHAAPEVPSRSFKPSLLAILGIEIFILLFLVMLYQVLL